MAEPDPTDVGGDGAVPADEVATGPAGARWSDRRRWTVLLSVAVVWLVLDQLTKWWAVESLPGRSIDLVWTLRFRLAYNRGASFSIGGEGGWGPVIAVVALGVIVVLLWHARSLQTRLGTIALGMIVGGAVGNLVDRALRGDDGFLRNPVVDFIDPQWYPVFNVADTGVVVGGILLAFVALFPREG